MHNGGIDVVIRRVEVQPTLDEVVCDRAGNR